MAELDLGHIIPQADKGFWAEPRAQYALYVALARHFRPDSEIKDGRFYGYSYVTYRSEDSARAAVPAEGEIVAQEWRTIQGGIRLLDVTHRKNIDLLAEARARLRTYDLAERHLVAEDIPPYEIHTPHDAQRIPTDWGHAAGEMLDVAYVHPTRSLPGAVAIVYLADQADGLDHDYLWYLMLAEGARVTKQEEGQTLVASVDGKIVTWKAGPRQYLRVTGGGKTIVDAYLKKFPSVLPADYKVDKEVWLREEVRRTLGRLRASAAGPDDGSNRYLWEYLYLCRLVEPVKSAPLLPPWDVRLEPEVRQYHFSLIWAWWEKSKADFRLRDGAPLPRTVLDRTMPRGKDQWQPVLEVLREAARKAAEKQEGKP
jgi:hypothetical protein